MSALTKALKRTNRHPRKRKRLNKRPTKNAAKIHRDNRPLSEVLFADPIFMHYLASGMLRLMELTGKLPPMMGGDYSRLIDAEFPELPDEFKKEVESE